MWDASPLKKVQGCRRYPIDPDTPTLRLRVSPRKKSGLDVGFADLQICGCWHSCVKCAEKIAIARAEELAHVFRIWRAMGGGVVLATLSARHHKGHRLRELVAGQRAGWAAVRSDRAWKRDLAALGVAELDAYAAERAELRLALETAGAEEAKQIKKRLRGLRKTNGLVRAFETTFGDEWGWHPHYHVFFLVERPISKEEARELLAPMWDRWCTGLAEHGLTAVASVTRNGVEESAGFDVSVMETGEVEGWAKYPFKLGLEAVGGVFKSGRSTDAKGNPVGKRHRTPFEVMEGYAVARQQGDEDGAAEDLRIIREWSQTADQMRFRQCPFPPGLRAYFAAKAAELDIPGPLLAEEKTDEEVAAAEAVDTATAGHVGHRAYRQTIVYEMDTLKAAGRRGFSAVVAWFEQRHIPLELTPAGEALLGHWDALGDPSVPPWCALPALALFQQA